MKSKVELKIFISVLVVFFFLAGCDNKHDKLNSKENQEADTTFLKFLNKFKKRSYPFIINDINSLNLDDFPLIENNSADTVFFNNGNQSYCIGLLPDTVNFYSVIIIFPTDKLIPVLVNYDKLGKTIDYKSLYKVNEPDVTNKSSLIIQKDSIMYIDSLFDTKGKLIKISQEKVKVNSKGKITSTSY